MYIFYARVLAKGLRTNVMVSTKGVVFGGFGFSMTARVYRFEPTFAYVLSDRIKKKMKYLLYSIK